MIRIQLHELVGEFAENKDIAKEIRMNRIIPNIDNNGGIILDFAGVTSATQSFIHALISDIIRKRGASCLDKIYFQNCNETIKKIIEIVVEYMQDKTA